MDSTKTLKILSNNSEIKFSQPTNVLDLLNANEVSINQSCGGFGTCTTCRIIICQGEESFSVPNEIELERANERNFLKTERLSCQTIISGQAEIEIPT